MKIAIDGRSMQDKVWTGVGHYTYNLLRALFEIDKENEYHILYNGFGKLNVPEFKECSNVRIHISKWPNKLLKILLVLFHWPKFDLKIKPDVFFVPNLNFCSFSSHVKVVSVAHDLYFEHFPEFASLKTRLWHKFAKPKQLLRRSDKIIAVSNHTKTDVIETYGIPAEKINVVYPGMDFFVNSSGGGILYFGALEPRKNIEGLIEAYALLKNPPRLVVAGCSGWYVSKLRKKIKNKNIELIENPSEIVKKELYVKAGLFVYPSFYEGFGFPPLEAMSAGVPVVASSASSVPEICGNAAILVNPFNVNEIKEGMRILLEDNEVRNEYVRLGLERVKEFSWEKCAEQILKCFKDV